MEVMEVQEAGENASPQASDYSPYDDGPGSRPSGSKQFASPSAYSPFKVPGASPSPRRQLPMSPYASAGEVSSVDSSVHGQLSHRVRNTLLQRKRQLSTLTSAVLTKIAGASTSQYDDFETAEVDEDEVSASPMKRGRKDESKSTGTVGKLLATKVESMAKAAVAAKAKAFASAAQHVRESTREASKINWPEEVRHELLTAGSTLQATARAVVQSVEEETDAALDVAEASIGALASRVRAAASPFRRTVSGAAWALQKGARTSASELSATIVAQLAPDEDADGEVVILRGAVIQAPTGATDVVGTSREGSAADLESSAAASLQMAVETVGTAVETVGTAVASGIGMVGELGSAVEERLFHAEESLLQTGGALGAALGGAVSERIEAATSTLAQQANAAVGDTFAAVEHAGAAVGETIDAVEDALETVERSVEEVVSDGLRAVGAELGAARDGVGAGVGAVVQSAVAPFRALSAEAVHSAVGVVASEMREGVKDLTTDAQVMALRVEEKLLAFNSSLHGLASRVVGALQRQQSADLAATAAAAAAPPSLEADAAKAARAAEAAKAVASRLGAVDAWEAEVAAALQEDA
jgi:hypothetical protein